jgi:hypothetical protein
MLPRRTIQDWEQHRREPSDAARVLLFAISRHPKAVEKVLWLGELVRRRRTVTRERERRRTIARRERIRRGLVALAPARAVARKRAQRIVHATAIARATSRLKRRTRP